MKQVGRATVRKLSAVKPNDWNPNEMTPHQRESLKHGLRQEGWIASQALLVWGADESGVKQNLIIDGEHRYLAALELGYAEGPMVVLNGLTRDQAVALTIKLDSKRGQFDQNKLGELVRELGATLSSAEPDGPHSHMSSSELGLTLGLESTDLKALLEPASVSPSADMASHNVHTKQVPLYMSVEDHERFMHDVTALGTEWSIETLSDVVLRAIKEALL